MQEVHDQVPKIHLVVCVNVREERAHCGTTITRDDIRDIKKWIIAKGLLGTVQCTASFCQGHCNNVGGVATIHPSGRRFKGITSKDQLRQILEEEMKSFA
jgi:hypothetical protein